MSNTAVQRCCALCGQYIQGGAWYCEEKWYHLDCLSQVLIDEMAPQDVAKWGSK